MMSKPKKRYGAGSESQKIPMFFVADAIAELADAVRDHAKISARIKKDEGKLETFHPLIEGNGYETTIPYYTAIARAKRNIGKNEDILLLVRDGMVEDSQDIKLTEEGKMLLSCKLFDVSSATFHPDVEEKNEDGSQKDPEKTAQAQAEKDRS